MGVVDIPAHRNIAVWNVDEIHEVQISGYEPTMQKMNVTSNSTRDLIEIDVMRVYLGSFDGVPGSYEWNIASKQCMALVNGLLAREDILKLKLKVTRSGIPPHTKWSVEVSP
jgi:hypothetical protein